MENAVLCLHNFFGIEKDHACQEELLHNPHSPDCLFDSLRDFLRPDVARMLQHADTFDKKKKCIMSKPLRPNAWCVKHGSEKCRVRRAMIHVTGTPCIHDTTYGLMEKESGKDADLLLIVCRQRREFYPHQSQQAGALHVDYLVGLSGVLRRWVRLH